MKGLKKKRLELSLSIKELASKLGLSQQAIYYYENGKRFPKKELLNQLTIFFNCTIDELM